MPPPINDLNGVWTYAQRLSNVWASPILGPTALLNGTVVKEELFLLRTLPKDGVDAAILEILDERAGIARFIWDDRKRRWLSTPDPADISIKAGNYSVQLAYSTDKESAIATNPSPLQTWPLEDTPFRRYATLHVTTMDKDGNGLRKGDVCVTSGGDGTAAPAHHPLEYVDFDTNESLTWGAVSGPTLTLTRCPRYLGGKQAEDREMIFGDRFQDDAPMGETGFPFYGFDPRGMDLFGGAGQFTSNTGTQYLRTVPSNSKQTFIGQLLFRFPYYKSADYVRGIDPVGKPFIPLGTSLLVDEHTTHMSQVFESSSEKIHAQGSSLGVEGGVGGMLKVSGDSETETKDIEKWRYSHVFDVSRKFAYVQDRARLVLKEEFVEAVQMCTKRLLRGEDPQWRSFVRRFGTHYCHAGAEGWLRILRTAFSLELEETVRKKGSTLKVATTKVFEGLKAKAGVTAAESWQDKFKVEYSGEYSRYDQLGSEHQSVMIALDLRPISELLNPIFFRPHPLSTWGITLGSNEYGMNNKDQWHQLAPLVWFTVRRSLEAYLTSVGVGQPLSLTGPKDLTPTVWKASVTFMKYTSEDGKFDGYSYVPRDLAAQLSLVPAAAAVGHEPLYVEMYRNEPALPSGLGDLNPGQGPDVTFIGRGNSLASLKLKFQCPEMTFRIPARGTPYGTVMPINIASFKFDETIEASSGVFTITQKKKGLGERNYTMVIKGSVANLGPAGNAS